jgi:hypothetical protein
MKATSSHPRAFSLGELLDPFTNEPLFQPVLIRSTGQDGKEARGMKNDPKNRDNATSW